MKDDPNKKIAIELNKSGKTPTQISSEMKIDRSIIRNWINQENASSYYYKNKPKILKQRAKYRKDNAESISKYLENYRATHKEKQSEYDKNRRLNRTEIEKESERERKRISKKTPLGKARNARMCHRRNARLKNTEATLTLEQWNKILKMQDNRCAGFPHGSCNTQFSEKEPPQRDHIIPLSKGGGLTFENVQALCGLCNAKKGASIDKSKINSWLI